MVDGGGLEANGWRDMICPSSSKHSEEIGVPEEKDSSSEGNGRLTASCHGVVLKSALSWLMQLVTQHDQKHLALISFNKSELSESPC